MGNPSPKTLRKSKTRTTKSEARVDPDNNNSQESLEQEFDKKLDLESKFFVVKTIKKDLHGFLILSLINFIQLFIFYFHDEM